MRHIFIILLLLLGSTHVAVAQEISTLDHLLNAVCGKYHRLKSSPVI